eukprot:TRINITY_DN46935_c0_g1_i1.p1 TRINITY_DN46935_c0_g1~~TRINITY_DN46935_c0_g1_i1.p1  ORF type:complete len:534 (+),score=102.81 TRINITY_DN46935_c0_g1_i1:102-1703(+)
MFARLIAPRRRSAAAAAATVTAAAATAAVARKLACAEEATYSAEEVGKHRDESTGVWVSYQGNVYDVTTFLKLHPGGYARIMQGAGGDVQSFFDYWHVHKQPLAQSVLSLFRIGRLAPEDAAAIAAEAKEDDPYADEPTRSPGLLGIYEAVSANKPYVAEPIVLPPTFTTPAEEFYVRNHAPVPTSAGREHSVEVSFEDDIHLAEYTLPELEEAFGTIELHATLQCTGNRLSEMYHELPVDAKSRPAWRGRQDVHGHMIGNALWRGVPLAPFIQKAAAALDRTSRESIRFIEFHGADGYWCSVPAEAAMPAECDAMLAMEMNGAPLLPDHGAPLRLLLPGIVGARNVKWVERIVLRSEVGDSPWDVHFYRDQAGKPILHWPVNSLITHVQSVPVSNLPKREIATLNADVCLQGVAYAGGGVPVEKVDVSMDDGETWTMANIVRREVRSESGKQWAWATWEASVPLPNSPSTKDSMAIRVASRATTADGSTQPLSGKEALRNTPSGYLYNPCHVVEAQLYLQADPSIIVPTAAK